MPRNRTILRTELGVPTQNVVPKRIARVSRFMCLLRKFAEEIYDTFKQASLREQELFISDFESSFGPLKQLRKLGV